MIVVEYKKESDSLIKFVRVLVYCIKLKFIEREDIEFVEYFKDCLKLERE
jgi:hypothetical protein